MSISGLVVTLAPGTSSALDAIAGASVFDVGPRFGDRQALALTAADGRAAQEWTDWLQQLPGVVKVDVACSEWTHEVA